VAPGADTKSIRLTFPEARHIRIDPRTGDLRLETGEGEFRLHKPVAYQGEDRKPVVVRYSLRPGKQVTIETGAHDVSEPLIIDPVLTLIYSTDLGGSGGKDGRSIAVDASGNAYVTGYKQSLDFPTARPLAVPNNSFQGGDHDVFVSKLTLNAATSTLSLA
jgi:hypothetical protein